MIARLSSIYQEDVGYEGERVEVGEIVEQSDDVRRIGVVQLDVRRVHLFELHIDTENNKKKKKKCNILLLEVEDVAVCFRGKKRITLQSSVSRCFESERGCMTSASCPRQTCTLDAVWIEKN